VLQWRRSTGQPRDERVSAVGPEPAGDEDGKHDLDDDHGCQATACGGTPHAGDSERHDQDAESQKQGACAKELSRRPDGLPRVPREGAVKAMVLDRRIVSSPRAAEYDPPLRQSRGHSPCSKSRTDTASVAENRKNRRTFGYGSGIRYAHAREPPNPDAKPGDTKGAEGTEGAEGVEKGNQPKPVALV
jgi:hypothetical protein